MKRGCQSWVEVFVGCVESSRRTGPAVVVRLEDSTHPTELNRYVRGWIGYFGLARQFDEFVNLDGWIRRRIRMCYWKQWRHPRTKVQHLVRLGVNRDMANTVRHSGCWRGRISSLCGTFFAQHRA